MASSGVINTNAYSGRYLQLAWNVASQNVAANTTTISWSLTGRGGSSATWYKAGAFRVIMDGSVVYSSATRINLYAGTTVASGTVTLAHSNDGSRSFSAYTEGAIYTNAVNVSASGSWALPTIPRESKFGGIAGNTITMPITIPIIKYIPGAVSTITYAFGATGGTIAERTAESLVAWTPPIELLEQIPKSSSGTLLLTMKTYSGSTQIGGAQTASVYLYAPNTAIPTIGTFIAEVSGNPVTIAWQKYIQGQSKVKLEYKGLKGYYGSTIISAKLSANFFTATVEGESGTYETQSINVSGNVPITLLITDSRGKTATETIIINVVNYDSPFGSLKAFRTETDISTIPFNEGTYVRCLTTKGFSSCEGLNSIVKATLSHKKKIDTTYGQETEITTSENINIGNGQIEIDFAYDVKLTIGDKLTSTNIAMSVAPSESVLEFKNNGKGISIGGISEDDGLDVYWKAKFRTVVNAIGGLIMGSADYMVEEETWDKWEEILGGWDDEQQ